MKILALDQATATGWSFGDEHSFENKSVEFGTFRMPKRDVLGERLLIFGHTLIELVDHYRPALIACERPYWPQPKTLKPGEDDPGNKISVQNLQFLQKVHGLIEYVATEKNLPYESYASSSWRVTALGMGRAPKGSPYGALKKMMVQRARALGYAVSSEDEADAIGILMHALHGEPAKHRAQGDLLKMAEGLV